MQYVVKNTSGYYKFFRKIPNTNQQFIFSLNTKNYKIASKIVTSFLLKSNQYFLYLKNLTKEAVMDKIEEIKEVLEAYKLEALNEYSEFEKSRHKHFKYNGADGSSPEAIEHWVEELKEHIIGAKTERQSQELVRQILKRSTLPLKHYYQQLDNQYKEVFMQLLIKCEASILKEDYKRAKEYFDLDYHLEQDKDHHFTKAIIAQINTQLSTVNPQKLADELSFAEKEKYRSKTKFELYEKFLYDNQHRKNEKDKIQPSILTLLQSSKSKYIIDYEIEDYDIFFNALLFTPAGITLKKKIFLEYEGNFVAIAEDFENNEIDAQGYELEMQSITTLEQKLIFANNFLKFCKKNGYLDNNILDDNLAYSIKKYENIAKRAKERAPFNADELIKMFDMMIENGFFKEKIEQFYIPMIALFSGLRVEEIAQLEKRDIVQEDKIYYFNINHNVKTASSIRKVPIHNFLIEELKFLDFIATKKDNEKLFNLDPLPMNGKNKYSHYYIMDFSKLRKRFVSKIRIDEDLVSFHSFRHTFSSRLDDAEVEESKISRLLGHKLVKSETPRYIKTRLKRLNTEVQKLDIKDIKKQLSQLASQFNKVVKF